MYHSHNASGKLHNRRNTMNQAQRNSNRANAEWLKFDAEKAAAGQVIATELNAMADAVADMEPEAE